MYNLQSGEPINIGCGLIAANGETPNVKTRTIPCQVKSGVTTKLDL